MKTRTLRCLITLTTQEDDGVDGFGFGARKTL